MSTDFQDSSTIFHQVSIPGVRFMTARGWAFPWRKLSSSLELTFLEAGGSDWRLGRWTGTRGVGSLSVVTPGRLAIGTRIHAPGDFFSVEVDRSWFGAWRFEDGQHDGGPVTVRASRLARLVRAGAEPLAVESALWSLLEGLRSPDPLSEPGAHDERARRPAQRMRDFLHARYDDPLSLADLARAANVSRFHSIRAFRDAFGVTPFEYLAHVRLERAATALRAGARPIDVAARTGFSDQAHLTRWFVKMFRVTPAVFARAHARITSGPMTRRQSSQSSAVGRGVDRIARARTAAR